MLNLLDGWFKINPGDAAFYALLGFVFVFLGITVLILIFTLLGFIMKKITAKRERKQDEKRRKQSAQISEEPSALPEQSEEGITPELIAILTAAVAACMSEEKSTCEFVVRRIKKL